MKSPMAMIQQVISNETLQNVRSLKDFETYTKENMAHRMTESVAKKMEFSSHKDDYNNLVVRGKVFILSPSEYQEMAEKTRMLQQKVVELERQSYRVQDTGGTIPNRPMTEQENRSFWGIFG
jgi:hypothetical protein